jgi:hypothetical protein
MKDHRLSRWDSVSQPNFRRKPPMKDHRLSRWDSVSQPYPGGATDTLARFCRPSRPVLLFSNGSRGYALRARPWLPTAAPAALTPGYQLPRLRRSNDHVPIQSVVRYDSGDEKNKTFQWALR